MNKFLRLLKEACRAIVLYKNWWMYYGDRCGLFTDKIIKLKMRNGIVYFIKTNDSDVRILDEIWNREVYDRLMYYVKPSSVVIDIGAQVGIVTVKIAHKIKNGKVYSFEPLPKNRSVLEKNIEINNLKNRVIVNPHAVAAQKGSLTFYSKPHDSGGGSLHPQENADKITVQTMSLSDIFETYKIDHCDFLKMDCEGAEIEIVENTPNAIFEKITSMTIEWHGDHHQVSIDEFRKKIEEQGFKTDFHKETGTVFAYKENE
jgi:FkbM family methyltransferase